MLLSELLSPATKAEKSTPVSKLIYFLVAAGKIGSAPRKEGGKKNFLEQK